MTGIHQVTTRRLFGEEIQDASFPPKVAPNALLGVMESSEESSETTGSSSSLSSSDETLGEKLRREEEESLELARMLMAEEAMSSYHHSVQFLSESRDQLSQEDYEALEAALQEEHVEQEEEFAAQLEEDDEGNLSYETMLQLGERIGDVKGERWQIVAQKYIDEIPTETFCTDCSKPHADDSEVKCLVCQHEYENQEKLRRLPCGHCFHSECVDQWLLQTDLCPYCRTSIRKD
mmetsp:Transcript_21213/g.27395  ORF Transcript_21213/g.27395 Transcript_21213/m.27395 type:complete len:234 (-) Transcript_21213:179-880(-)